MTKKELTILTLTREIIRRGYCTGRYARRANGENCGVHCSKAVEWDLAGALWLACEQFDEHQREANFAQIWRYLQLSQGHTKSVEFCRFLDTKSQSWHLDWLTSFIEPRSEATTIGSTAKAINSNRIKAEYV